MTMPAIGCFEGGIILAAETLNRLQYGSVPMYNEELQRGLEDNCDRNGDFEPLLILNHL